jgi:aminopeptidase
MSTEAFTDHFFRVCTMNFPDLQKEMEPLKLGFVFSGIELEFHRGRVVDVRANDRVRMEEILDTDGGARYVGDFAIGINPYLRRHIVDTLFDEKMAGSLHFTPAGTDDAGVRSKVHWDIIQSHLAHYGGGEIHLDGKLWRKDGLFVDPEMRRLNPNELSAILEEAGPWGPGSP